MEKRIITNIILNIFRHCICLNFKNIIQVIELIYPPFDRLLMFGAGKSQLK